MDMRQQNIAKLAIVFKQFLLAGLTNYRMKHATVLTTYYRSLTSANRIYNINKKFILYDGKYCT